jgi:diacylglycerol kinase family enzyme
LLKGNFTQLEVNADGKIHSGIIVCVSNGKYYGTKLPIANAKIDENKFDVIIIKKISIRSVLKYILTKKDNKNIAKLMNIDHATIDSKIDNYPAQIDGDYCYNLPIIIESTNIYLNIYYF